MLSEAQSELLHWAARGLPLLGPAPEHQGPLFSLSQEEWAELRDRGLLLSAGRLPEPQDSPELPYVVTHVYWITEAGRRALDPWQSGRFASLRSMF